ncbi:ester cyclase [Natrialba sp. PRR66]|uniref:ester cyclase n=1 Tax=Natrialba sp. PRR66 TaxID=3098146 RepID=UPI002B1DAB02|nr:ester cyclase [Natrialba sp. PRR66]
MSADNEYKAIAKRYVNVVWNDGNVDAMDDVLTDQQVYHDPTGSGEEPLSEFKSFVSNYHETFPDLHFEVEHYMRDADYVAFWGRITGTHEGPFMGIEPTGESVDIMSIHVVRIADGKIAERWANVDLFGLLQQIGHDPLA